MNNFSHHLTHHLYQYYILTDHLREYSESDESGVDRSWPDYTKAARKCETSLHTTPSFLDNIPNLNSGIPNIYARSKMFKEFGGCEASISKKYCAAGRFCVYAFNHGYVVCFRKRIERPQSCMRCNFRCHKMCARRIFPKFMCMPQRYVCNKCYKVFLGEISNERK